MVEFVDVNGKKQSFDEKGHFNIAFNADCMEFLRNCPDNAFQLCVCDPPYGDGNGGSAKRFGGMFGAVYGENTSAHVADAHERERERRRTAV